MKEAVEARSSRIIVVTGWTNALVIAVDGCEISAFASAARVYPVRDV